MEKKEYTYEEIYMAAVDTGFGAPRLRAKDNAQEELREAMIKLGFTDPQLDDCREDSLDIFIELYAPDVRFDEYGNLIESTIPTKEEVDRVYSNQCDELLIMPAPPLMKIDSKSAESIIETRKPLGLFFVEEYKEGKVIYV